MPAYFVARFEVKDAEILADYSASAGPIIAKYQGKVLFKGGADQILKGADPLPRIAVFEFPDSDSLEAFYNSEEYQLLGPQRDAGANMVLSAHS